VRGDLLEKLQRPAEARAAFERAAALTHNERDRAVLTARAAAVADATPAPAPPSDLASDAGGLPSPR
jgi:hypothetical protein